MNFNPDHIRSTAQTFMSTRPVGRTIPRIKFSVRSLATPEVFLGHEIHTTASGAILSLQEFSLVISPDASVANKCTKFMPDAGRVSHRTFTSIGKDNKRM